MTVNVRCKACGCRWADGPTTDEAPCPWCGNFTGEGEPRPGRPNEYGERVVLAVRIPAGTRDLLARAAADGDVTTSRLASTVIAQWLQDEGYEPPRPTTPSRGVFVAPGTSQAALHRDSAQ